MPLSSYQETEELKTLNYELLEALKIAREYAEQFKNKGGIGEIDNDLKKINSAIAKAEHK